MHRFFNDDAEMFDKNNDTEERSKIYYDLLGEDNNQNNNDVYLDMVEFESEDKPQPKPEYQFSLSLNDKFFLQQIIPYLAYFPDLMSLRCVNKEMKAIVDNLPIAELAQELASAMSHKKLKLLSDVESARNAAPLLLLTREDIGSITGIACCLMVWCLLSLLASGYLDGTNNDLPGSPHIGESVGIIVATGVTTVLAGLAYGAVSKCCFFAKATKANEEELNAKKPYIFAPLLEASGSFVPSPKPAAQSLLNK